MPTHDIIDNRSEKLVDHINRILASTEAARFAVGYFFLSRFTPISSKLAKVNELRLLLVRDRLEGEDPQDILWDDEITRKLADFQKVAVKQAIQMIKDYGGAFVADVVGLGKSYIGTAIVKHFERTDHARPLILCPAPLAEMWELYNEAYEQAILYESDFDEQSDLMDALRGVYGRYDAVDFEVERLREGLGGPAKSASGGAGDTANNLQ